MTITRQRKIWMSFFSLKLFDNKADNKEEIRQLRVKSNENSFDSDIL